MKNKFKLNIKPLWVIILFVIPQSHYGQKSIIASVGFYNLENLFDIVNDTLTLDEEFTPEGDKNWTEEKYRDKLNRLSTVIKDIGTDYTPDGLAILGVSEIENKKVLEDLVQTENLKNRSYQIIHYNSPDDRGVDVALLYQEKYFHVVESKPYSILLKLTNGDTKKTRDVLLVKGYLDQQLVYILVNHWPSRRGGEAISLPKRNAAAAVLKQQMDSVRALDPNTRLMAMGDFNDDPVSSSFKKVLKAVGNPKDLSEKDPYLNLMYPLYKNGVASLAYQDAPNLFDQIIVSGNMYNEKNEARKEYSVFKAELYAPPYLITKEGNYKGYPFRSWAGDKFTGGYSDHFPAFVVLQRAAE